VGGGIREIPVRSAALFMSFANKSKERVSWGRDELMVKSRLKKFSKVHYFSEAMVLFKSKVMVFGSIEALQQNPSRKQRRCFNRLGVR
jgi:hypothetical protein